MTTDELAELFLASLYDMAEAAPHPYFLFTMNEFAPRMGISDMAELRKAISLLEDKGLVYLASTDAWGGISAGITMEGSVFVEKGGETGIIERFRTRPFLDWHRARERNLHSPLDGSLPNGQRRQRLHHSLQFPTTQGGCWTQSCRKWQPLSRMIVRWSLPHEGTSSRTLKRWEYSFRSGQRTRPSSWPFSITCPDFPLLRPSQGLCSVFWVNRGSGPKEHPDTFLQKEEHVWIEGRF